MTPPAGWTHSSVASTLGMLINQHVRSHKLGMVFESSAGYDLSSGDTVEPDLTFVSASRFAAVAPTRPDQFLQVPPNLVVEILSPSTAKRDQTEKKAIYARNGVDEYWIVDPRRNAVTVFRLDKQGYDTGRTFTRGTIRSHVLPKLRISVAKLFAL